MHATIFHHLWCFTQTIGDDKVEDPNEWLSVDIGDLLEVSCFFHFLFSGANFVIHPTYENILETGGGCSKTTQSEPR